MGTKYPKRNHKKDQNRHKLETAACILFSTKGHQYTTLSDIADRASLHVQTLYRHFKNKEEITIAAANLVVHDCRIHFECTSASDSVDLQSIGAGMNGSIENSVDFSLLVGVPLTETLDTNSNDARIHFKLNYTF